MSRFCSSKTLQVEARLFQAQLGIGLLQSHAFSHCPISLTCCFQFCNFVAPRSSIWRWKGSGCVGFFTFFSGRLTWSN